MYKLNLKTGGSKIIYNPLSICIKYLIDDKKLAKSLPNLEKIFNIKFSDLQRQNFLSEEGGRIRVTKPSGKPDALILVKVKLDDKFDSDYFRNHLAELILNIKNEVTKNLHIIIPAYSSVVKKYFDSEEYYYQTFAEGILLGNYSFDKYKSKKNKGKTLDVFFYADNEKKLKHAISVAEKLITSVNLTRDLQNEPANNLTPDLFSKRISVEAKEYGIKTLVFGDSEIKKRKMGGLIAIGQGSINKPRFIVLEYKPKLKSKKNKKNKTIALVGKGITFDTGGISIKPSKGMGEMKADMSGAAVVVGTMIAAAKNNLPVHLYGIIPSAENMVSGESIRPGDIIKISNNKTVEIEDTDAEGRVVLADALHYASQLKPDQIIDLATLTGACVVALGEFVAGLFTKDEEMATSLYKSGIITYDRVWRLPMWDDFNELITSDVADVANLGHTRWAGAITAAKFLEHFVDKDIPWTHLDIAGPAMNNDSRSYTKKYMTGFGVRLLFDYLSNRVN
jgi:leucyl aminopeptidase